MLRTELKKMALRLFSEDEWQTRMAEQFGISARTVRRWAAGEAPIRPWVKLALEALIARQK